MTKRKQNKPPYLTFLDDMERRNKKAFKLYLEGIRTFAKSFTDSLTYNPSGLFAIPENRNAQRLFQKQIIQWSNRYIVDVYGSFQWQQAYLDGKNPELPLSLNGQAILRGAKIAREVMQYTGYDAIPLLQEQLNQAIDASRTMTLQVKSDLMTQVNDEMRNPLPPGGYRKGGSVAEIYDYIKTYGNERAQRYAETIARGTILGTYRGMLDGIGTEIGAEYCKIEGPFPLQYEHGHIICQEFYLRPVPYSEIEEFINSHRSECEADGITSLADFRQWCGGYNCRHTATPIGPNALEYALEDAPDDLDQYDRDKRDPEINVHLEEEE